MATILVIGPQRTGTSAVAGVLHHLGIDMGVNPISPNYEYFESDAFIALSREVCGEWQCPQFHFAPDAWRERVTAYAAEQDKKQPLWGAKSPYFSLIGHHILPLLSAPKVIFCDRDFESTVESLHRRERHMQKAVCRHIQGQSFAAQYQSLKAVIALGIPSVRVPFDALIDNPAEIVSRIADFVFDGDTDASAEQLDSAIRFIDPHKRRNEAAGNGDNEMLRVVN
jgi:hypothetical protein